MHYFATTSSLGPSIAISLVLFITKEITLDTSYTPSDIRKAPRFPHLDKDHGYFASATVTNSLNHVVTFCKDSSNVEKVLRDFPEAMANFLKLKLESDSRENEGHRIVWSNSGKASGKLIFLLSPAPQKGTIVIAEAVMDKLHFREDGPSTLMNVFLKRMKALLETGEIPTTKGQPSGREEITSLKH